MAINDAKELSMDEILASIRSILHDGGAAAHESTESEVNLPDVVGDVRENSDYSETESLSVSVAPVADVTEPEVSLSVFEETAPASILEPRIRLADAGDFVDDNMPYLDENDAEIREDVTAVCYDINRMMHRPAAEKEDDDEPQLSSDEHEPEAEPFWAEPLFRTQSDNTNREETVEERQIFPRSCGEQTYSADKNQDVSAQIIESFAALFAARHKRKSVIDSSVRELAEKAVINEVVPVLAQWLNEYLPELIHAEIERRLKA